MSVLFYWIMFYVFHPKVRIKYFFFFKRHVLNFAIIKLTLLKHTMFFHFFGMTRKNLSDAFVSFKTSFQTLRWRQSFSIISITRQQFHLQKMKLLIKKFTPFNTNLTFLTNIILNSCGNPIDKFHVTSLMGVTKRLLLGYCWVFFQQKF